jgi:hypothetical protein
MKITASLAISLLTAPLPAQVPVSPWPQAVRAAVGSATAVCREAGGKPGRSPDLVKTVDLTADGMPDYLIDWSKYECVGAVSAMENGQSGATLEILVGLLGKTAVSVYSASVYGAKVETVGGRSQLWIDVAASECGQNARGVPFSNWQFCSRALVWNKATRKFAFAPISQKRRIG